MPSFVEGGTPPADALVVIPSDDPVIGVYANGLEPPQHVVVTEDSIVFFDERWRRVLFAEITRCAIGLEDGKLAAEKIHLECDHKACGSVIVSGGGERHRDVFEFSRFLDRVIATHRGEG
jgi:hypothetical protein